MSIPSGATTEAPVAEGPSIPLADASVPPVADPLYTVGEVADVLGVSVATIYIRLKERDETGALLLPSVKVGNARRVRKSDLEAYIAGLEPQFVPAPRKAAVSA